MHETEETIAELGNEPPLIADGRSGPPDRREVSARWLSGTFLTGVTSTMLMGVALLAALDGREQLATPPEIIEADGCRRRRRVGRRRQDHAACRRRARSPAPRTGGAWKCRRSRASATATSSAPCRSCRSRWRLRPATRRPANIPAFDPLRRRLRRRRAAAGRDRHLLRQLDGQGRKRHEPQDRRLSDGDGRLRREERAFGRRGRRSRALDRLRC